MIKKMIKIINWFKQLFCNHCYATNIYFNSLEDIEKIVPMVYKVDKLYCKKCNKKFMLTNINLYYEADVVIKDVPTWTIL
jgi:hypothetical protein